MIQSMTGYGKGKSVCEDGEIIIEIRSVNRNSLEISTRLPDGYLSLEPKIKKYIQNRLHRGHINVTIQDKTKTRKEVVKIDESLVRDICQSIDDMKKWLGIDSKITVGELLRINGVIVRETVDTENDKLTKCIDDALKMALDDLIAMRGKEGESLCADIVYRIKRIDEIVKEILKIAPAIVKNYQSQLEEKMKELIPEGIEVDENRLYTEVAIFSEKCDITEELVRMNSHVELFKESLQSSDAVGKKLDFILQEMNRETNTIGSKAYSIELTQKIVALKDEIEKIREQVQNIE